MKTKAELLKEITELKEAQANCHGTKCEVYSRVVGYLRPVQGWNKGKKEEYAMRKVHDVEHPKRSCGCQ